MAQPTQNTLSKRQIEAVRIQMTGLHAQKRAYEAGEYMAAMLSFELKGCEPRIGFICILHEGKKYVYPHYWVVCDGKMIDIAIYKRKDKESTEWFVKPGVILDEETFFEPVVEAPVEGEVNENKTAPRDKKIYIKNKPFYFYDKAAVEHFLYKEHIIEDYEYEFMQHSISSKQKMKTIIRAQGEANYKKFARSLKS